MNEQPDTYDWYHYEMKNLDVDSTLIPLSLFSNGMKGSFRLWVYLSYRVEMYSGIKLNSLFML